MKDLRELVLWQKHLLFVLAEALEEESKEEGFNSRLVGFDKTNRKTRTKDIHPAKMVFLRPRWILVQAEGKEGYRQEGT